MFREIITKSGQNKTIVALFTCVTIFAFAAGSGYAQQEALPDATAMPPGVAGTNGPIPGAAQGPAPVNAGQPMPAEAFQPTIVPVQPPTPMSGTTPGQPQSPMPGAAPVAAPKPPEVPKPAAPMTPAVPTQPRVSPAIGGSSFFFDDADVFEVIQTVFGEVLRVNYIIDPSIKGRVNFRTTTPIPRDKILSIMEIILRLNGIAVVEESGLYRIIPIGNIAKEPAPIRFGKDPDSFELKGTALMQLTPLTYINSSEMASILTPLLTQGGAIYDIQKKNILIIADTDANVRRLLQVVAMFDVDTYKDASQPKVYVYALQNTKAEHIAKILQQVLLGAGGGSTSTTTTVKTITGGQTSTTATAPRPGPTPPPQQPYSSAAAGEALVAPSTKIIADDVANSLVIFASPGDYSVILGAIKQIDTTPRQVMIEAVVAEVDLADNLTFGLRWNLNVNAHKLNITPFTTPVTVGGPLGFQGLSALTAGAFGYTAIDSRGNVRVAIEADVAASKGKILSAPNILVADNREARIQVGSQIPIATSATTTPGTTVATNGTITPSNTTTSTIQYKDVGTILKVKPQINDSGLISLEISQEVSDFTTQSVLGTEQFVITKNEVSTNLLAQDGETIVIGGLVNEKITYSRGGIPFLSTIPVLGYLFGQTVDSTKRTELVILLTPRVVRNQVDAKKLTSDYYELFKNVSKELDLERHKKSMNSQQQSSEMIGPQAKDKVKAKASPPASQNNSGKTVQSEYPLKSED